MSQANNLDGIVRTVRKNFERYPVLLDTGRQSHVKQEFLAECDINNILKRYRATGLMRQIPSPPMYGDFSNLPSYQDALNTVNEAEAAFMALPSDLRTRFDNDPQKFLDFAGDPDNLPELRKLGLAKKEAPPSDTDRVVAAIDKLAPATTEPVSPPAK